MSNETLDVEGVNGEIRRRGPSSIVDYLALIGDTVDNIPGVDKVGPKTAAKWLAQYGSLEGVIAHAGEIPGVVGENLRKVREWLPQGARARDGEVRCARCRSRSTDLAPRERDRAALAALFQRFGFKSWLKDVQDERERRRRRARHAGARARGAPTAPTCPRNYETLVTEDDLRALALEAIARAGTASLRHRDDLARSVRRRARRRLVLDRARRSGVHPARAPLRRCARPARRRTRRCAAQPVARGRFAAEARPEPQVRPARAREPRRAARRRRARHAAPVLRARERRAARHGRARRAASRSEDDHLRRGHREGRAADRLRAGRASSRATEYSAEDADVTLRLHGALYPRVAADAKLALRLRRDRDAGARGAVPHGAQRRADRRDAASRLRAASSGRRCSSSSRRRMPRRGSRSTSTRRSRSARSSSSG